MKWITQIGLCLICFTLIAAKPKSPGLPPGDMFFTMKGQPYALERTFPGIVAAFMFSDDQKVALNEAYNETVGAPDIREQGASLKGKGANDAERESFRKLMEDARAELAKEVASILTPEQKALIPKIQAAAEEAQKKAREAFAADLGVKGEKSKTPELQEKIRVEAEDNFVQELEKFLTPAQMEAARQAAVAQKEANEQARKKKLGK
jgi:hypothetical protein